MKKIKNLFVVFLIIYGVYFIISCSPEKELKISYLQIWSENLNKTFERKCQEWGEKRGVKVMIEPIALKDLDMKIASMMESQTGIDLAVFPSHQIIIYKDRLADFSDIANKIMQKYSGFYEVPTEFCKIDNSWYGIPLYSWSHIWVYRSDILKKNNLSVPEQYDEIPSICACIAKNNKDTFPIGIGLGKSEDAALFFQSLLWAFGGKITSSDGKAILINSQETRNALKFVLDLYEKGYLPKGTLGWDDSSNNKNYLAGKLAITMNSPTIYYVAKRENTEIFKNTVHALYPKGPSGQFSYATGFTLSALKENKKIDLIKSLIEYLFEFENYSSLISAGEGSVNPSVKGFEGLEIWKDPNLKVGLLSMSIEKTIGYPGPLTKGAAIVFQRRILTDMFGRIINDGLTIDEAINEAEKSIKEIYENYK